MNIKAICRSNLDDFKTFEWPTKFAAVPTPGQWVGSKNGERLKVSNVTHLYAHIRMYFFNEVIEAGEPFIEIELTNSRNGCGSL